VEDCEKNPFIKY